MRQPEVSDSRSRDGIVYAKRERGRRSECLHSWRPFFSARDGGGAHVRGYNTRARDSERLHETQTSKNGCIELGPQLEAVAAAAGAAVETA